MKWLLLLLATVSFSVFSFDNAYNVTGVAEILGAVEGVAYHKDNDTEVYGQLVDENGNVHSFEGNWVGNGLISGETDDGDAVELNTH